MSRIKYILIIISFPLSAQVNLNDTLNAARLAYNNGDFSKAFNLYKSAENLGANKNSVLQEFAQSAYRANNFKEANQYYQELLDVKTGHDKADQYFNLGNTLMKLQNYKDAAEAYKQVLRLNPNDEEARYNLSQALRKIEKSNQGGAQNNPDQSNDSGNNNDPNEAEDTDGKLEENTIEKTLDRLMRKESETKQEINNKYSSGSSSSSKDW